MWAETISNGMIGQPWLPQSMNERVRESRRINDQAR
jgi:hypothetical protein